MFRRAVLPAFYLACSWTWVIGMYFPVYLVGDFGWPGWVAFAVPNVIGAAAMGAVLRRPGAGERLVADHGRAMWWFGAITVAFHVSVLSWLLALAAAALPGVRQGFVGPIAASVLTAVAVVLARVPYRRMLAAAPLVWVVSLAAAAMAWWSSGGTALAWPPRTGAHAPGDLALAMPALLLGFALCPYLDLTFHRARRETPGSAGVLAFALGFGGPFLVMITLSLFYAGPMLRGVLSLWLLVHIAVQSVYTMALHLGEMRHQARGTSSGGRVLTPVMVGLIFAALCTGPLPFVGKGLERTAYEAFMACYAIVFPGYAWIVMLERGLPRRARLVTFAAAVLAAMPFMWLGWTQQHWALVPAAVGIVLIAPFIARAAVKRRPGTLAP